MQRSFDSFGSLRSPYFAQDDNVKSRPEEWAWRMEGSESEDYAGGDTGYVAVLDVVYAGVATSEGGEACVEPVDLPAQGEVVG